MAQESWKREKDETDCKAPEGLILCINNCGLFGSAATMNMCSKCYKDSLVKSAPPPSSSSSSSPSPPRFLKPSPEFSIPRPDLTSLSADTSLGVSCSRKSDEDSTPPIRHGNRCSCCRKRVGLTGFRCRCGELFCARHRYSDTHDCSFDYKAAGREEISKANPVVKAAKIIKI